MLNILLYSQVHSCEEGALHRLLRIKDTLLVVSVSLPSSYLNLETECCLG